MPPSLLPACLLLASLGPALPQVWAAQNRVSSCRAPQKCVSLLNCPSALQGLRDKRRPLHCGFAGRVPDVCCPPPQSASPPTCASRPSEPPPPSDLTCDTLAQHYADNVPPDDDPSPGRVARRSKLRNHSGVKLIYGLLSRSNVTANC
ncbi:hypothetical protein ONE63_011241 [Megalurothrips usitatus]|uniref:Uncharacterized protein n=1 Tax=Megalurothrips usitatus TaxID=439358 RepID=A0AAV7X306_9NEOP|nr:hypothetical protein ONE63_011241 [Megalurothrips usitatus]